nr:hypothetical protein [Suid alphaherpesvirus 1]
MEVAAALTEDFAAWRLLRSDSRVKVYAALAVVGARLAAVAPGAATVAARVYLTRPRALRLAQGRFHVVVLPNDAAYALVAAVTTTTLRGSGGELVRLTLGDASLEALPADLPVAEPVPAAPVSRLDLDAAEPVAAAPAGRRDCVVLAPGAWWARGRVYFLQMDPRLLALCPAGWRARHLGAVLAGLLSPRDDDGGSCCRECRVEHVDALNATPHPDGAAAPCLCAAPCLWRQADKRELRASDSGLFRVLFLDAVRFVRMLPRRKIVDVASELIGGLDARGRHVVVNDAGWRLVALDPDASRALVCGCPLLRALCDPPARAIPELINDY